MEEPTLDFFSKGDVTYYRLYMSCPKHSGGAMRSAPKYFWSYKHDGGELYIGNNAQIYCPHNAWSFHVSKAQFYCPECSSVDEAYVMGGFGGYNDVVPCMSVIIRQAGVNWLQEFLKNL